MPSTRCSPPHFPQGVPRIKEIINASKTVATPVISVTLDDPFDMSNALLVKGRCQRAELGQLCRAVSRVITQSECYILFDLDLGKINDLRLELTAHQARCHRRRRLFGIRPLVVLCCSLRSTCSTVCHSPATSLVTRNSALATCPTPLAPRTSRCAAR